MAILRESASLTKGQDGVYQIRIIGKDIEGSSGFWPADVVEKYVPAAFPKGTKINADHDPESAGRARSVMHIMGKLISDPISKPDGMYADVYFGREYQTFIEDFHDVIGMSIAASGETEQYEDKVSGKMKTRVTSIKPSPLNSVDVVSAPGAQGKIMKEALKDIQESLVTEEEKEAKQVDEKDIQAIAEAVGKALAPTLEAFGKELVEALAPAEEEKPETDLAAVTEAALEAGLTKRAREKVVEAVKSGAELKEAIAEEKAYHDEIQASLKQDLEEEETGRVTGSTRLAERFESLSIFAGDK